MKTKICTLIIRILLTLGFFLLLSIPASLGVMR